MNGFWKQLFSSAEGHSLHRPIVGWSCAILFGTLSGLNFLFPFSWLISATIMLLLAWCLSSRWTSLCLIATLFSITAWYGSTISLQRIKEEQSIQYYKETNQYIDVIATIGDDRRIVQPKRGPPYLLFTAKNVTFVDGTAWKTTTLRVRYYGNIETFPKRGERWQFNLKLYQYPQHDRVTGSARSATSRHLTHEDETRTFSYLIGTIREKFAKNLSYGIEPEIGSSASFLELQPIQNEKMRLVQARDSKTPLPIKLIVDAESYQRVERKRGKPYYKFKALEPTFSDGTPIQHTVLNIHFYNNDENLLLENGFPFPQRGEHWQLDLIFRKSKSTYPQSLTATARPTNAHLLPKKETNPKTSNQTFEENEPFDAITPLRSILLGAHYKLPYEMRQQYADAGIIHIFAISGLHVGILCALFILILSWVNVRTYLRFFFLFPMLIGYLLLTDAPPSATRACIMAIIYCFAATQFRKGDMLTSLLITADIVILFNPFWLYHIGALLSFSVMGGILLWYKPLTLFFSHCFFVVPNIDDPIPECYPIGKRLRYWVARAFSVTCAAWIVALPLCLYFFQKVSLVGLILNLFVPFLTIFIVWGGILSACIGFLLPCVSALLNKGCAFLLEFIYKTTSYAGELPFASIRLNAPPHGILVICFMLLILFLGLYLRVKAINDLNERLGKIVKRL